MNKIKFRYIYKCVLSNLSVNRTHLFYSTFQYDVRYFVHKQISRVIKRATQVHLRSVISRDNEETALGDAVPENVDESASQVVIDESSEQTGDRSILRVVSLSMNARVEVRGPIWENRFSGIIAREKSRSNVLYPRAVLVLVDGSWNVCSTFLSRSALLPQPCLRQRGGQRQHWWDASRKCPPRPLEVRSGRIKSYFNVNAVEASARVGQLWDYSVTSENPNSRAVAERNLTFSRSREAVKGSMPGVLPPELPLFFLSHARSLIHPWTVLLICLFLLLFWRSPRMLNMQSRTENDSHVTPHIQTCLYRIISLESQFHERFFSEACRALERPRATVSLDMEHERRE